MTRDSLLAAGLLLSTASQMRLAGLPVGPGEICLVVWLMLALGLEVRRLGPPVTPALLQLSGFWALFAIAQSIGTLTGFAMGDRHDADLFVHDAIAYPFLAAVSCLSVVGPGACARLHRVAWLLAAFGIAFLASQLAAGWGLIDVLADRAWFWDRFRGWSENPNQLAFLCAVLGLVSLHLAERAPRSGERFAAIACIIGFIYVGQLTKSDTFSLVVAAAAVIFITLKLRTWLTLRGPGLPLRSALAWIVILGLPMIAIAASPLAYVLADQAGVLASGMSKDNGVGTEQEALLRIHSWREAVDRGLQSGMLGLGPGPHLEIPPVLVAARASEDKPQNLSHPSLNGMPNFEAHNTLLDLFTQGGLLAVLTFAGFAAISAWATYRAKLDGLTTLLCGLAIFGVLHLIVRHPVFWFAVALCVAAGAETPRTLATGRRS